MLEQHGKLGTVGIQAIPKVAAILEDRKRADPSYVAAGAQPPWWLHLAGQHLDGVTQISELLFALAKILTLLGHSDLCLFTLWLRGKQANAVAGRHAGCQSRAWQDVRVEHGKMSERAWWMSERAW